MDDETKPPFGVEATTTTTKSTAPISHKGESEVFGISVRGLIVMTIVLTVCVMSFVAKKVEEPLYTLASLTVGYYFGQNQSKSQPKTV